MRIALARRTVVLVVMFGLGCGDPRPGAPALDQRSPTAPEAGQSAVDAPHVVFTASRVVVDRLGVAVALPVSGPSRPSPSTLASDDPGIVHVDEAGRLVAARAGKTRVRAVGQPGTAIDVEVRPATGLAILPAKLVLEPGRTAALRLVDSATGEELDPIAAVWSSSAPQVLAVRDAVAHAAMAPGEVTVTARYGGLEASIPASVGGGRLRLDPDRLRLRVGEARQLRAFAGSAAVTAQWGSRDARVVASGPLGLVLALAPGKTDVCAVVETHRACSAVEVTP
jgi:hypothetical protein